MDKRIIKKINRYFHDEESQFFQERHVDRIGNESTFYESAFKEIFSQNKRDMKLLDIGTGTGMIESILSNFECNLVCTDISFKILYLIS